MHIYIIALFTALFLSTIFLAEDVMKRWPGYLLTTSLLVYAAYHLYHNRYFLKPYRIEVALILFATASIVSSLVTNTDPLQQLRHILYGLCTFLVIPRTGNAESLPKNIIYITSPLALAILSWSFSEWITTYIETGATGKAEIPYGGPNPNHANFLLMAPLLALTSYIVQYRSPKIGISFGIIVTSLCVITFQTRSFMLGIFICILFLLFFKRWHFRIPVPALIIITISTIFLYFSGVLDSVISRGTSHRLEIWYLGLSNYPDCSILWGCGKEAGALHDTEWSHMHNVYLGTLVNTGALSFILLIFFLSSFLIASMKAQKIPLFFPSTIVILGALLTSSDYFLRSFNKVWFALWLSLTLTWIEILYKNLHLIKPPKPRLKAHQSAD